MLAPLRRTCAAVFALALAANLFAELVSSAQAMACCHHTDYACAGLRSPDDCCRHMGHVTVRAPAGTSVRAAAVTASACTAGPVLAIERPRGFEFADSGASFKRPHDPPHLHGYHPLI